MCTYPAGEDQGDYGQINATLWKNQNKLILFNNIGGDYTSNQPVAGFVGKFFTGDTSYIIPPNFSLSSVNNASSVFVSNGSVYTAGYVTQGAFNGGIQANTFHKATIWKNGAPIAIGDSTLFANPNALYVSGNDVYAAGYTLQGGNNTATIWKNGTPVSLSASGQNAIATSIFVLGTDVYVGGNTFSGSSFKGVLWKNGVATLFIDATNSTFISGVFVK